ncbi:hypothetical protein [Rosistilla oblonga]|uniref:hypothetical protein n=1 Tax=Rosistilla oblonga TaxID=2527990 RepID=UPI003A984C8E
MATNATPNPYQPPRPVVPADSRLSRFVKFLRRFPWTTSSRLLGGGLVIIDGIAFYLDPSDSSVVFAASPSATNTNERMNLIVAEAVRVLPILLAESSSLTRILRGRKMVVRMLDDYSSSSHAVIREEVLDWDILNAIIDGGSQ